VAGLGHWYVEVEKQGFWRGAPHSWVNRYIMSGSDPTSTEALAVMVGLIDIESQLHANIEASVGVGFVEGRAYGSGGGAPFAVEPQNTSKAAATATGFAGAQWSGTTQVFANTLEVCSMVETLLTGLSTTGKPKYLRKYFRGAQYGGEEAALAGGIPTVDKNGIAALVLPWKTGVAGTSYVVIGASGATAAAAPTAHPYMVNHQVPRGRKKKVASSLVGVSGSVNANQITMTLPNPLDLLKAKRFLERPRPLLPEIPEELEPLEFLLYG
jgi:hypothetical protein